MKQEASLDLSLDTEPGDSGDTAERRKAVRYRLEVPLVFRWQGAGRSWLQCDGVTRDISAKGAYVIAVTSPPAGAVVHVEVYLLGFHERKSRIKARMKALRVDTYAGRSGRMGFALKGDSFQSCRAKFESAPERSLAVRAGKGFWGKAIDRH
jgi:PilZ domain